MSRNHRYIALFSLAVSLSAIITTTNAFAELAINTEYSDSDISIAPSGSVLDFCTAEYADVIEVQLRCLNDAGFLYAHLDLSDEKNIQGIVAGPQVRLASLRPVEAINYLSPQLLMSISGMELGQPVSVSSFQRLAYRLQAQKLSENVEFRFDVNAAGMADVMVVGGEPNSRLNFGAYLDQSSSFSVAMYGQHFSEIFTPGYIDYHFLSSTDLEEGQFWISVPFQTHLRYSDRITLGLEKQVFFGYFEEEVRLAFNRSWGAQDESEDRYFVNSLSLDLTQSSFSGNGLNRYDTLLGVNLSSSFIYDRNQISLGLSTYVSDTTYSLPLLSRLALSHRFDFDPSPFFIDLYFERRDIFGDIDRLPVGQRLFFGGDGSIRGLRDREGGLLYIIDDQLGGDSLSLMKVDFLRKTSLWGKGLDLGLHLDGAILSRGGHSSNLVLSSGFLLSLDTEFSTPIDFAVSRPVSGLRGDWLMSFGFRSDF